MGNRSLPVLVGILFTPTILVYAVRLSLPALDLALSTDRNASIVVHGAAFFIGLALVFRPTRSRDHEYLRSGAIDKLSKTYELEDAGLWSRADQALAKLEAKSSRNRKLDKKGGVSEINHEAREIDIGNEEPSEIVVSGIEYMNYVSESNHSEDTRSTEEDGKRKGSEWSDSRKVRKEKKRIGVSVTGMQSGNPLPRVCRSCGVPLVNGVNNCDLCGRAA